MGSALGNGRRELAEEVPVDYKRTEVGVIPEEWDVSSLGEMAKIATGGTPPTHDSTYYGDEYPFVSPVDLGEAKYVTHTEKGLSKKGFAISRRFPAESILFVSIGSTIGKCGVASVELTSNQQINAILPSPSFSVDYLYYTICSAAPGIKALAGEQAVPIVNKTQLSETLIALAPKPEQRAIAETLSDVDGLLAALEALIAKKRAIKQAAMLQLLTGKSRLPGFSGAWETKKISEVATYCNEKNSLAEDLPVLTCSKHLGFVDSLRYFKNQVFSKDLRGYKIIRRGQIGYPANHIEEGSIGLQDLYDVALVSPIYVVCSPKAGINSYFLHRLLKLDCYRQEFAIATTSSIDRRGSLKWSAFSELVVNLPYVDEQRAIASVLSDMDAEIASLERRRDKTRVVKQGMMQQLLTGRVRLVEFEALTKKTTT